MLKTLMLAWLALWAGVVWAGSAVAQNAVTEQQATATEGPFVLEIPDPGVRLHLSVTYPVQNADAAAEQYPLIVFFHGALCSAEGYSALADYWASHGYVVIMPSHPEFGNGGRPDSARAHQVFLEQITEMSLIVDSLQAIETKVPAVRGMIDSTRVVASGHSMGALIAAAISGLPRNDLEGERLDLRDERFDVAVLLSGPGPLPNTPEGAWDSMTLPVLVTTGTRDHANRGGEGATWEWRLGAFELTPPQDKFALVVDGADHFLSGMLCAERATGEPDQAAFDIVADVTMTFMDAYIKGDVAAQAALSNTRVAADTAGRAELRTR